MKNKMKRVVVIAVGAVVLVGINVTMDRTPKNVIPINTELNTEIGNKMEYVIEPAIDTDYGSVGNTKMSASVVIDEMGKVTAVTSCDDYGKTCEVTVQVYYRVGEEYYYSESTNSTIQIGGTSASITKTDAQIVGAKGIHKVEYKEEGDNWTWTPITSIGMIPEGAKKE